jgi:hypothetical protein
MLEIALWILAIAAVAYAVIFLAMRRLFPPDS